jgi:hypothetical protein
LTLKGSAPRLFAFAARKSRVFVEIGTPRGGGEMPFFQTSDAFQAQQVCYGNPSLQIKISGLKAVDA